ncbi:hypothetical protein JCM3770_005504 [Rhodotorula araucariae]
MLRTRLCRLDLPLRPASSPALAVPHLRALTASAPRRLARPPSFTTPEPRDEPAAAPHDPSKPLPPLPPTNLPVEDYASPLVHTASFFSQLFRYAVYGSVAVVLSAATALVAVHLYVEHVELAAPALDPARDDPDDWLAEQDGWSGLHTPARGGTDPRLGIVARAAIRGAYIAQTWGAGVAASPLAAGAPGAAANASPFAVTRMGGAMIGAQQDAAAPGHGRQASDAGWLLAERYLVFALLRAAQRGIALEDSAAWEQHVDRGGVDRAAVELEERLAGIRERIGGRARLEAARDGWERIYYALEASPTDPADAAHGAVSAWERREKLLATRKLGELSARIADFWREGTDERRVENDKAEGWFLGGLVPVLAAGEGQSLKGAALDALVPGHDMADPIAQTKHLSPSSSFFGFWSRSHPPATPPSPTGSVIPGPTPLALPPTTPSPHLSPELSHLLGLLPGAAFAEPLSAPATQRALLASLVSLETFLARRRDAAAAAPSTSPTAAPTPAPPSPTSLAAAQALQSAALLYARALLPAPAPAAPHEPSLAPARVSRALTNAYTATRTAALETHLAECTLALAVASAPARSSAGFFGGSSGGGAGGRGPSSPAARRGAADLLAQAKARAEEAVDATVGVLALLETSRGGRDRRAVEKAFGESLRRARRDADKVRELATGLETFVAAREAN